MNETIFKVDRCLLMKEFDAGRVWSILSGQQHENGIGERKPKNFYLKITEQ